MDTTQSNVTDSTVNAAVGSGETTHRPTSRKVKESLCWSCKNCTNADDHYCPWSESFTPVPGWTAKKTMIEGEETYHVEACPLYDKDPEYYDSTDPQEVYDAIKETFPEFRDYYISGNKALLELVLCEYRGVRREFIERYNAQHKDQMRPEDIPEHIVRKLKQVAMLTVYADQDVDDQGAPQLMPNTTLHRGLNMINGKGRATKPAK